MRKEELIRRKETIVREYGAWTAHNIRLPHDLWTLRAEDEPMSRIRSHRYLQIVSDVLRRPLGELRVLDLGCLEGGFSIEFGLWGANVVGIDGRKANVAKAEFARDALRLQSVTFAQQDIRSLSLDALGSFDVILCVGVFYHLPSRDLLPFLRTIRSMCRGLCILDTHISLAPEESFLDEGKEWKGRTFLEHRATATPEQVEKALWAAVTNEDSFWLTEASLMNALHHTGFTSIHSCVHPPVASTPDDRKTYVAIPGTHMHPRAMSPRKEAQHFELRHYERGQDPLRKKQETA